MPVTISEKFESRATATGANAYTELMFVVQGSDDDQEIKTELDNSPLIPSNYNFLPKQSVNYERVGYQLWLATVRYSHKNAMSPQPTGGSLFSFDTGGGTRHITQSITTISKYPAGSSTPDYKGAIGIAGDNIEGVDITVPIYKFSESHYIPSGNIDAAYRSTLFALTGKVNNAAFREYAVGECLFLGASGSKRSDDDWEMNYSFAASPNATNLTVGDITDIDKKGWEYMWVLYKDVVDDTAKSIVKKPAYVYIEKVYEQADFSLLGI